VGRWRGGVEVKDEIVGVGGGVVSEV